MEGVGATASGKWRRRERSWGTDGAGGELAEADVGADVGEGEGDGDE